MAKKKYKIYESIPRTPEERKWVEDQLNKERTPEELKRAVLGQGDGNANWGVGFNKKITAKLPTCLDEPEIFWKEIDEEAEYADGHFSEIKRGFIDIIKQNPQEWEIMEQWIPDYMFKGLPESEWKSRDLVVEKKWGKCHYKNGFAEEEWAEIENALDHNKNNTAVIRKCGFSDCEKRISWEATECNNCWNRKENYVCDACCQKQNYNISYLIGVRDFINDTEIFLKRIRGLIAKLPKFYDQLKEVEKSLILIDEEKQAEKKNHSFRINFLQEKNGGRQRDNTHLFKLCRKCLDELAEKEKVFFSENPDVKKVGEKWKNNRIKHSEIFKQIANEIGEEEWKRIWDENGRELGLKVEEEKNPEKEKLNKRDWPWWNHQEEGAWKTMEEYIKGKNRKVPNEVNNYNKLTQSELKKEIQKVKLETEEIKNNKNLSNSERQTELQKKKEQLAKLEKLLSINTNQKSNSDNTNFPTNWVVGGIIILTMGLITAIIIKKNKKKK